MYGGGRALGVKKSRERRKEEEEEEEEMEDEEEEKEEKEEEEEELKMGGTVRARKNVGDGLSGGKGCWPRLYLRFRLI